MKAPIMMPVPALVVMNILLPVVSSLCVMHPGSNALTTGQYSQYCCVNKHHPHPSLHDTAASLAHPIAVHTSSVSPSP
jgi:hypothetical protein